MDATDWIAGYAAVVATAALSWQVWQAREARKLRVSIHLSSVRMRGGPEMALPWALTTTVINAGDHDVRVTRVWLIQRETDTNLEMSGKELPGIVPAQDSRNVRVDEEAMAWRERFDPQGFLVVNATLATGEKLVSEAHQLGS